MLVHDVYTFIYATDNDFQATKFSSELRKFHQSIEGCAHFIFDFAVFIAQNGNWLPFGNDPKSILTRNFVIYIFSWMM